MRDETVAPGVRCWACNSDHIVIAPSTFRPGEFGYVCYDCGDEINEMAKELTQAEESLFWYWMSERHAIFLHRAEGKPKPWTTDPILRDYKFTNPFRENDRGTVWLRENFLTPHRDDDLGLVAFNIAWYRMFNWWGTGELLGWQTTWDRALNREILTNALHSGKQVFTGAHIVYSPPGQPKVDAIVKVCEDLYHMCVAGGALVTCAREDRSLQKVYEGLRQVHCVGGFMAYEMVTDMRHTRLLEDATDIYTWANLGPGAARGLRRLGLPATGDAAINSMHELMLRHVFVAECFSFDQRAGGSNIFPRVEMRDIEHSLCEFDKYCRVKFGEGKPRSMFNGRA